MSDQRARPTGRWTQEEISREERVREIRARRDREKPPEERLQETLKLSRLVSQLRDGHPDARRG